ncbi:MAG: COG1615 family transporter, partial [Catenulispora sp.]|nr:COG1615 family transporter [Catenulispora sp.]
MTLPEHPPLSRRGRTTLVVLGSFLIFLLVLGWTVSIWTDWLWYDEVGYTSVLTRELSTRLALFGVAAIVVAVFLLGNFALAVRLRPFTLPLGPDTPPAELVIDRLRFGLTTRLGRWIGVPGVVLGVIFGLAAQGQWKTWLLFRNAQPFGTVDPLFGEDIGFSVFRLPFWQFLLGAGFALITLALAGSLAVHVISGAVRFTGPGDRITPAARIHLTTLIALFVGLKAVAYALDKRALVLD